MPSFRTKVLDALDIHKKTIKLQVNERFPKTFSTNAGSDIYGEPATIVGTYAISDHVDYAVSKCIRTTTIGPSFVATAFDAHETAQLQKLDLLGFVVGESRTWSGPHAGLAPNNAHPDYLNSYPYALKPEGNIQLDSYDFNDTNNNYGTNVTKYDGFHELSGLYDPQCEELKSMRKAALPVLDHDTLATAAGGEMEVGVATHAHKDWPDNTRDQLQLLNQNPYADSLYYHSMKLSMLITGITIPNSSEKASNHRGVVRMLILRPRMPSVRTRWSGTNNEPIINMDYPPHFETDLFYSGKKTLGGRLDKSKRRNDAATDVADSTHLSPTFGLKNRAVTEYGESNGTQTEYNDDVDSIHYGHMKPHEGKPHDLTAYDIFSSPINREKFAVVVDKTFTLDTRHHGVASTRIENIIIPFNKKVKFAGRKPWRTGGTLNVQSGELSEDTFDEPLNMRSRPIVMFLSLDQKISCQVTGYTAISEV